MKKKIFIPIIAIGFLLAGCEELKQVASDVLSDAGGAGGPAPLTNTEVISGLREALTVGTNNSTGFASKLDGFWGNSRLRIPFPAEAQKVKDKALQLGLDKQVEKFELTLNRAAEEACKSAAPIFIDAIKGMTIGDGFAILKGDDNAATNYLREKTSGSLKSTFKPIVHKATETVQLTKYWSPVIDKYNKIPLVEKMNPDLDDYAADKAMAGLFLLIEDEEKKIRKDPMARVSDLLKRVFGG